MGCEHGHPQCNCAGYARGAPLSSLQAVAGQERSEVMQCESGVGLMDVRRGLLCQHEMCLDVWQMANSDTCVWLRCRVEVSSAVIYPCCSLLLLPASRFQWEQEP